MKLTKMTFGILGLLMLTSSAYAGYSAAAVGFHAAGIACSDSIENAQNNAVNYCSEYGPNCEAQFSYEGHQNIAIALRSDGSAWGVGNSPNSMADAQAYALNFCGYNCTLAYWATCN